MKPSNLTEQLRRDEGEVLHEYKDHLGYSTIGVGILIDKRKGGGITREESAYLLANRIASKTAELVKALPWVASLDEARKGALLNMAFQMGVEGLLGFTNSLKYVERRQYKEAAANLLLSKWAKQTPERAQRIAKQIELGEWQ